MHRVMELIALVADIVALRLEGHGTIVGALSAWVRARRSHLAGEPRRTSVAELTVMGVKT